MFHSLTKTLTRAAAFVSAVAAVSTATAWETGERQKYRQFYQNVTAQDLPKLIGGKVWVSYDPDTGKVGASAFVGKDRYVLCGSGDWKTGWFGWSSVVFDNKPAKERYPL